MDYQEQKQLEGDLWEAADQLRANSKLTASEYAMPVLGLIFLRHATTRFNDLLPIVEKDVPERATGALREARLKMGFAGKAAIYLPENARYDYLAALPQGINIGIAIREAMHLIEESVTDQAGQKLLEGALPKDYLGLEQDLLAELIKIFNRPALQSAQGDVFGRIYEYFLNQFAQSGAQEGGEFFTPPSLVRLIVNMIEPDHGIVLDPACGSAGMFVQTGHFIEEVRHKNTHEIDITFYGQEKADLNSKLARMNLAVHGLEGNIRIGNTFYEDLHQKVGCCDFVMANPPFNVDGVQVAKIKNQLGEDFSNQNEGEIKDKRTQNLDEKPRLPFGLPGIAGKSKNDGESISNANSLWIQYFYSYLNQSGRAGFVMASSASDAGNKDKEIRQKLVDTGHVDIMISIGPKFFYTKTLPCTLWFFDKGKPEPLQKTVLMIDARNVFTVVSARSHVFSPEQLSNLSAISWLYRGQNERFTALIAAYQRRASEHLAQFVAILEKDTAAVNTLLLSLNALVKNTQNAEQLGAFRQQFADAKMISDETITEYQNIIAALNTAVATHNQTLNSAQKIAASLAKAILLQAEKTTFAEQKTMQNVLEKSAPALKEAKIALEARHKAVLHGLDYAEKNLRAHKFAAFKSEGMYETTYETIREAKKALQPRDLKKREAKSVRDESVEALQRAAYFVEEAHWLLTRFPEGKYADVQGLCKAVTKEDIADNDYSLTPGRYVGVAEEANDEGSAIFLQRMQEIHAELGVLNAEANALHADIARNFEGLA